MVNYHRHKSRNPYDVYFLTIVTQDRTPHFSSQPVKHVLVPSPAAWTATVAFEEWQYTYVDINRDYVRHPAGLRQREGTAASNTDYFLQTDEAALEYKIERDPSAATAHRTERSASLDQIAGGSFTSDLSNLATCSQYIEMYGDASNGFDSALQINGRLFLTGLGRFGSRRVNSSYSMNAELKVKGWQFRNELKGIPAVSPYELRFRPSIKQHIQDDTWWDEFTEDDIARIVENDDDLCTCDERCENREPCEDQIEDCCTLKCFQAINIDDLIDSPDTRVACGWDCNPMGLCDPIHCWYYKPPITRCCLPCNVCPELGAEFTQYGRNYRVIRTDLCPDDLILTMVGVCNLPSFAWSCHTGEPIDIPTGIDGLLGWILEQMLQEIYNLACPNVLTFTSEQHFEHLDLSGSMLFVQTCHTCSSHCTGSCTPPELFECNESEQ